MSFYYQPPVSLFGECCLTVATGPPAIGKTFAVKAFLSTIGSTRNNMSVTGTNRVLWERTSLHFNNIPLELMTPVTKKEIK